MKAGKAVRLGGATLVLAAGFAMAAPQPALAAPGETVVYESYASGSSDIWIMNSDGTNQVNLTAGTPDSQEYDPELSEDGTQVAFISNRFTESNPDLNLEIFKMDADGTDVTQLTFTDSSPPGSFVASYDPTWSPSGTQVAFSGYRGFFGASQLFTVDADGTNGEAQITTDADFANKWEPDWSPDGSLILYTWGWDEWSQDLHVINPDGTGDTNLHPDTVFTSERNPQWSPDGTRIALRGDQDGDPEVWVMEYPSLVMTSVTDDPAIDESPTWSPDGTQIMFSSTRGGTYDLYVVDAPPVPAALLQTASISAAAESTAAADGATPVNTAAGDQNSPFWGVGTSGEAATLTVLKTGRGKVISRDGGIRCGVDCTETLTAGQTVLLRAQPQQGWVFARWSGACRGKTATCTVAVDGATTVMAHFVRTS